MISLSRIFARNHAFNDYAKTPPARNKKTKLIRQCLFLVSILGMSVFTPHALAYLELTIETPELYWAQEDSVHEGFVNNESYFFTDEVVKLKSTFVIPEMDLPSIGYQPFTVANPVTSLEFSNLFDYFTLDSSLFSIWAEPFTEEITHYYWLLAIDITSNHNPHVGATRRGSVSASGILYSNLDSDGGRVQLDFYQDDWLYRRASGGPWEFDVHSVFVSDYSRVTLEKISVPEPSMPALFLSTLLFVAGIRWLRKPE